MSLLNLNKFEHNTVRILSLMIKMSKIRKDLILSHRIAQNSSEVLCGNKIVFDDYGIKKLALSTWYSANPMKNLGNFHYLCRPCSPCTCRCSVINFLSLFSSKDILSKLRLATLILRSILMTSWYNLKTRGLAKKQGTSLGSSSRSDRRTDGG